MLRRAKRNYSTRKGMFYDEEFILIYHTHVAHNPIRGLV